MGKIHEPGLRALTPRETMGALAINKHRMWLDTGISDPVQVDPAMRTAGGTVGKFYPNGLYMVTLWGVRSDGVRCTVTVNIDARWFTRPLDFLKHFQQGFAQLGTYRDCECVGPKNGVPGVLCNFHGTGATAAVMREDSGRAQTPPADTSGG